MSCLSAAKFVRQSAKVGLGQTRNGLARKVGRAEVRSEREGRQRDIRWRHLQFVNGIIAVQGARSRLPPLRLGLIGLIR